jgi:hypothetical protein
VGGVVARGESDLKTRTVGTFAGSSGKVFYHEGAAANILSQTSQIDAGSKIVYIDEDDEYFLTTADKSRTYRYYRKLTTAGKKTKFYTCDAREYVTHDQTMISTVKENMANFSVRESKDAAKARDLIETLGYPTTKMAMRMVGSAIPPPLRSSSRFTLT